MKSTFKVICTGQVYDSHNDGRVLIGRTTVKEEIAGLPEIQRYIHKMGDECKNCTKCKKIENKTSFYIDDKEWTGDRIIDCVDTYCMSELVKLGYPMVCPITGDPFYKLVDGDDGVFCPVYKGKKEIHTLPTPLLSMSDSLDMEYSVYNEEADKEGRWDDVWEKGFLVQEPAKKLAYKLTDYTKDLAAKYPEVDITLLSYIADSLMAMAEDSDDDDYDGDDD